MTLCSGFSSSLLTPITTVMSAPSAGAEMMTRLAPASRCFAAASRLVKMPVHSSATSTPSSRHGSFAGSRSAVTRILPRPISIQLSPVVTSPGKRPCTLSYLQQMRVGLDRAQIVDADDLDLAMLVLVRRPQDQPADAAEAVDRNPYRHGSSSQSSRRSIEASGPPPQPFRA